MSTLQIFVLVAIVGVCFGQLPTTFYSGYVTVDASLGANLFYYMVPSQSNPTTDPVILWLQGGPGCSSMFGNWVEQGPFIVQSDGTFKTNPYTWNKNATMIYIDSPVGTGFSYVKGEHYPSDETTIANDLYTALTGILFTQQPAYANNPFYITGESYGGKYVPYLAANILSHNASPKAGKKINLKAIAIGNGWVDPVVQTGSYGPFLFRHKLITASELKSAARTYSQYEDLIEKKEYEQAMELGNMLMEELMGDAGVNDPYDIRKKSDPTTPLANKLGKWLNTASTLKTLKVANGIGWELCDDGPYYQLEGDIDRASVKLLPGILAKIPVMLYNGDCDLICDMDGTASYATQIGWPGQSQYNSAPNTTWNGPSGSAAGTFQSGGGLVRAVVFQAGHMVPFDQPANAQALLWNFLTGQFDN
jgi:carboxypeptidase C (cathepsin A)